MILETHSSFGSGGPEWQREGKVLKQKWFPPDPLLIQLPDKKGTLSYYRKAQQGERRGFAPSGAFRPGLAENMPKGMFSGRCGPPPGR